MSQLIKANLKSLAKQVRLDGISRESLANTKWDVVPAGGSHTEGSVRQMCPGHGHIKQQLALGTKCPSRVVMHQHVLDVGRSFVLHCLVCHYEHLQLHMVLYWKLMQCAKDRSDITPPGDT